MTTFYDQAAPTAVIVLDGRRLFFCFFFKICVARTVFITGSLHYYFDNTLSQY